MTVREIIIELINLDMELYWEFLKELKVPDDLKEINEVEWYVWNMEDTDLKLDILDKYEQKIKELQED